MTIWQEVTRGIAETGELLQWRQLNNSWYASKKQRNDKRSLIERQNAGIVTVSACDC